MKYLVLERDRVRLAARLAPFLRPDPHATQQREDTRGYTVRSIYFDTPGLRDWAEKESGDAIRRKLRVRSYDAPGTSPIVLEIKRKEENAVWKDRAPMSPQEAVEILASTVPDGLRGRTRTAAERFLYRLRAEHRRPVLLVTYWREPLLGRFDPSLRVTFDRQMRVGAYPRLGFQLEGLYAESLRPVLPGRFILEVKFDRDYPSWMRQIVSEFGLRQQALSKYAMGMEAEARAAPWRFGGPAVGALASRPAVV
ncbi:MAG: polyphosphate polymerase domain-containing protein [Bacteroidota bacterium]